MRATALVLVAVLVLPGCLERLDPGALLAPGPRVPVSGCATGDACNVLVTTGEGRANEPSVAVHPADPMHVLVGAHDYGTPTGDVWAAFHLSRDGGRTWTHGLLPGYPGDTTPSPLTGYAVAGDAAVAIAPDGTAYYAGIAFHRALYNVALFVARSDDGGETWPHVTFVQRGVSSVHFNDKEYIAVDPETGDVYVTWTIFRFLPTTLLGVPVDPVARGEIFLARSGDRGATWSEPLKLSVVPWNQGSIPAVTPDGRVHVAWLSFTGEGETGTQVVHAVSDDGGRTFTEPHVVADVGEISSPLRNTAFRVTSMPTFAVDRGESPRQGALYVAWPQESEDEHADVVFSRSDDGGATWSAPAPVHLETAGDQFMPWMTVDARGGVHVLFLDRSEDPENVAYHARLASSTDGGATWTTQRLTDAPSDDRVGRPMDALGREGGTFIGDYSGLAVGGDRLYPVWPDLRHREDRAGHVDVFTTALALPR